MSVLGLVLFLGASVGNVNLLVYVLNYVYGLPLPHRLLTAVRGLNGLLSVAMPLLWWYVFGPDLTTALEPPTDAPCRALLAAYALACAAIGLVVFPAITLQRLLRREPAVVVESQSRSHDVAARLGYKPLGRGKYRDLGRLPGNQAFQVELAERTLALPGLPAAWDGLTILHVSDLHFCGSPDRAYYQHVMDLCREWGTPDLLALTGDYVDSNTHHRWIVPVLGRLRWRVAALAVLGNHDWRRDAPLVRRRLRRLGVRVLGNGWDRLDVLGQPLTVIGHEGPWFRPAPDLSGCPAEGFRLCLSHTPDNLGWARRHGIDLVLAGHNHGGQVRLPVLGSILTPSRFSRRYDCGTFHEPPTVLHVSRGLGGQHPLRYNCRPEVTWLVLRAGAT
jgi:predicted MPP superfamily phosphohydrolase